MSARPLHEALAFGWTRRPPVFLQAEASECGLACLATIAGWYGSLADLPQLRQRFGAPARGLTLGHLIDVAARMDLTARPLRLELSELTQLQLPCILHWDLNHYVVLHRVTRSHVDLIDPAVGHRTLTLGACSGHFTGVALELSPAPSFAPRDTRRRLPLRSLVPRNSGLLHDGLQILVLAAALEVLAVVAPLFVQWVVDGAVVAGDADLLRLLACGFLLLVAAQAGVGLARSWAMTFLTARLTLHAKAGVFAHLLRLPPAWFERRHIGDVVSRFQAMATVQRTLTSGVLEALVDGLLAVAMLVVMTIYSTQLAAVALASVLACLAVRWLAYPRLRALRAEQLVLEARESTVFIESARAAAPIRLHDGSSGRQGLWTNAAVATVNRALGAERIGLLQRAAQALIAGAGNVGVVYLAALAIIDGRFTVGMLFAFLAYKATFTGRVAALADAAMQIALLRVQAERIADIVLEPPEHDDGGAQLPAELRIALRGVSFRYADSDPWVLRGVDLDIAPGERVVIAGPSGGGKSTLLKILAGLLVPTEGEVRIGGVRLQDIGPRHYRRLLGTVLQDDALLSGSVAENIAFFEPAFDVARLEAAARAAAVLDDVRALPMGLRTPVGDAGAALSGGQRQRILLARAFYRQPRVLLLDEATSHLDLAREAAVNAAVRALGCTVVQVAHRPQTIAAADRVIVVAAGTISY